MRNNKRRRAHAAGVGRARSCRIVRDFERTGDLKRATGAMLEARLPGARSPVRSAWAGLDRVALWRATYRHLAERGIKLWKRGIARECARWVTINGTQVDLHAVARIAQAIHADGESGERAAQLAFFATLAGDLADTWVHKADQY